MNKPVVFDLDDYPINHQRCITLLDKLKLRYPKFKCTLFTIPFKLTAQSWIPINIRKDWIEIAVHGYIHEKDEFRNFSIEQTKDILTKVVDNRFIRVYKQPYWLWNQSIIDALKELNYAIAVQKKFEIPSDMVGYSLDDQRIESWHGHTHNTCNNGIEETFETLWNKWSEEQEFKFVSEVLNT